MRAGAGITSGTEADPAVAGAEAAAGVPAARGRSLTRDPPVGAASPLEAGVAGAGGGAGGIVAAGAAGAGKSENKTGTGAAGAGVGGIVATGSTGASAVAFTGSAGVRLKRGFNRAFGGSPSDGGIVGAGASLKRGGGGFAGGVAGAASPSASFSRGFNRRAGGGGD
jgi:hypothetical protein